MHGCRVGIGRSEITPTKPGPFCGWGPPGNKRAEPPQDPRQKLYVTAMALEDAAGERVVLINADLHCGGVYLWRAAVAASGLDASRVVLCGSHNHAGPGQRYGGLYFRFATASPFSVGASTRRLARLIEAAVEQALATLAPGGVGVGRDDVAQGGSNRAVPAWSHYSDEQRAAFFDGGPGEALLDEEFEADRMRDPRVTALVATDDAGNVRGVLAWYAVHANSLGQMWESYGSDLWGFARSEAERLVDGAPVGCGGGSSADISPRPMDASGGLREGEPGGARPDLGEAIGTRIGAVLGALVPTVVASSFSLAVAHEVWSPRSDGLPSPLLGMAMAGGGPDGPSSLSLWDKVKAGVKAPHYEKRRRWAHPISDGQGPKLNIFAAFVPFRLNLGFLFRLLLPRDVPIHVVRVGDHTFATVPGEATTMAGWRIEQRTLASAGTPSASVIGFAGDYAGYWVTPEEFLEQRYEAASTLYGRRATEVLTERLAALAEGVAGTSEAEPR